MILNVLIFGGISCLVFTLFILLMAYSGIASEMRDEEGNFRKRLSLKAIAGVILFASFLVGLLYTGNLRLIEWSESRPGFLLLWINALGIFLLIHIYDLLVLDYLVVVKWHPKFLNLPDTDYYTTFRPHLRGFLKGIPLGIAVSLVASVMTLIFH